MYDTSGLKPGLGSPFVQSKGISSKMPNKPKHESKFKCTVGIRDDTDGIKGGTSKKEKKYKKYEELMLTG